MIRSLSQLQCIYIYVYMYVCSIVYTHVCTNCMLQYPCKYNKYTKCLMYIHIVYTSWLLQNRRYFMFTPGIIRATGVYVFVFLFFPLHGPCVHIYPKHLQPKRQVSVFIPVPKEQQLYIFIPGTSPLPQHMHEAT